jgi:predicted GNAT family N-acyltransferase
VNTPFEYRVQEVAWSDEADRLSAVRRAVFVVEQHVPEALEWDEADVECRHVLALDRDADPVGTGRLLPDGYIGRMAVLAPHRSRGVGRAILTTLIDIAQARGDREVFLNAQTHAIGFYRRSGFEVTSGEFMEAGIAHVQMRRRLRAP